MMLTEFLRIQVAEDEVTVGVRRANFERSVRFDGVDEAERFDNTDEMGRATRECEAYTAIIDLHAIDCWVGTGPDGDDEYFCTGCAGAGTAVTPDGVVCPTLAALATVYADRPGYLDEWRRG